MEIEDDLSSRTETSTCLFFIAPLAWYLLRSRIFPFGIDLLRVPFDSRANPVPNLVTSLQCQPYLFFLRSVIDIVHGSIRVQSQTRTNLVNLAQGVETAPGILRIVL